MAYIFHIFLIILLGIITSYTDIKYGKIYNKSLVLFFILGILGFLFQHFKEVPILMLNLLLSLLFGFLFWYYGLWTAGDGKLFTLFSFLIPISIYNMSFFYDPLFNLIVNVFVPVFIFMFFFLLIKTTSRQKFSAMKSSLHPLKILNLFLSLFLIFSLLNSFNHYHIYLQLLILLLLLLLLYLVNRYLKSFSVFLLLAASLAIYILNSLDISFLLTVILMSILFFFFSFFIVDLGKLYFTRAVEISSLKEGDVIFRDNNEKFAETYLLDESSTISLGPEGLNKKDIKTLMHSKQNNGEIMIHQTIPFAPFLFTGALLSIITSSNIVIYLIKLLLR